MLIPLLTLGFSLGLLVNWLADSLPTHHAPHPPHCQVCGAPRPVLGWSGILGLVTGGGRCGYCGSHQSTRWPLIELVSMAAVLWLGTNRAGPSGFLASVLVVAVFLLISVIDIEHRLILHVVSLPSILILGTIHWLDPTRGASKTLLGGAAGFGIVLLLYLLGVVFSRWMARCRGQELDEIAFGFGDVTLATLIGVVVGWPGVILALMIGVLLAGTFSMGYVLWMLARSRYQPFLPIPYGPFLILGAVLVYYGGSELFRGLLSG